jgi:putative flippase GtrA
MSRLRHAFSAGHRYRAKASVFLRYGAGSLIAMGCSELVLIGSYDIASAGPATAAVAAWFAGAVPNYVLNKRWAWRSDQKDDARDARRARGARRRELGLYWSITLVTAAAAIAGTTGMDSWIKTMATSRGEQSLLLALAYLFCYGVVFIVKFVLFDRLVFTDGSSRLPAASPSTAPSNIAPAEAELAHSSRT